MYRPQIGRRRQASTTWVDANRRATRVTKGYQPGVRQSALAAKAVRGDDGAVALDVDALDVVEHAPALTDQLEQATTAVVVLLVGLEVTGEVVDAAGARLSPTNGAIRC